jgi:hypothetical protein
MLLNSIRREEGEVTPRYLAISEYVGAPLAGAHIGCSVSHRVKEFRRSGRAKRKEEQRRWQGIG